MSEIEAGDVVRLIGDSSVSMTVELVYDGTFVEVENKRTNIKMKVAKVLWFTKENVLHTSIIALDALEKVNG